MRNHIRFVVSLSLLLLLSGCSEKKNQVVEKVRVVSGAEQCALPGQTFESELILELLSPPKPGLLGGKGKGQPVAGVKVNFIPKDGSDICAAPASEVSKAGGGIRVTVKAGTKIGDQYLDVVPEGFPNAAITVRYIVGAALQGNNQETRVGNYLREPIKIELRDGENRPLTDVPVYFRIVSTPEKKVSAKCKPTTVTTDHNGIAQTTFKVGKKTGEYKVLAEIAAPERNIHFRGIALTEMALNLPVLLINVLGGLALFIFGMNLMSDGLQLVAGEKMRSILQFFAKNRYIAILAGTLVTAVIQSSSACSVMVIGFVNAGLLNLRQAIGIILGANIGTTITAQMISFKLGGLALPAIIVGLIITLVTKKVAIKGWGSTILGFGMLFFGMTMMSSELKLIGSFPTFIKFFQTFNCEPVHGTMPFMAVLGAVMIGTLMTLVVQSSSATIGIAIALAVSGLLNFYTAIPLILGDNIGTTITGVLASLTANKPSKQTAIAHVIVKLLGSLYMIGLFYVPFPGTDKPVFLYFVNSITYGDVFAPIPENVARHIAMAHTMFNVINVAVMLPLIGILAKLSQAIIKVKPEESVQRQFLEPHLLDTPAMAIRQAIDSIRYMVKASWAMIERSFDKCFLQLKVDGKLVDQLEQEEDKIDALQRDVTEYLVKLTTRELTENQADIVPLLMHCTNDAERIADHTENIIQLAKRLKSVKKRLSEHADEELKQVWKLVRDEAKNVIRCLHETEPTSVKFALKDEKKIDKLTQKFEKNHVKRLRKGNCDAEVGIIFLEMLAEMEKIGDHLSNIAERAPQIQDHYLGLG